MALLAGAARWGNLMPESAASPYSRLELLVRLATDSDSC
jgi:hypothetical protein